MRSKNEICDTLNIKKWWRFRRQKSLWAKFTKAKYCVIAHPVSKVWVFGNSHIWKNLTQARSKSEHNISWIIHQGGCNFWWDNWTSFGAIAYFCPDQVHSVRTKVKDFINNHNWKVQKLHNVLPAWLVHHISTIKIGSNTRSDIPFWNTTSDGLFTNKSAWESIRQSNQTDMLINRVWHNNIPFKLSFLCWRLIKTKLPFNDVICRYTDRRQLECLCCDSP